MKSILIFEYAATGEGWRTVIRFHNQSRVTDEAAIETLKAEFDPYFHVGFELHDISTVKDNESVMRTLKEHVPILYNYVMLPPDSYHPVIHVKYEGYVNYS
ncbi:hypothetical protein [Yersinia phage fHe-Yen9-04]|uniref:Uncharacterized protein n=1 Tax=Yersinia phage fHe-Yen9-04 TaxID=2052742 RepID=A0A2C9CXZ7_9CAUD|nr:hypothetical protein FDJ41_gp470 [Yersinia phage fHe-Yen9-04]SOK58710.1 hypothetical protein [Yersinia phage fHe-Yen9-04]VUE36479.1 hypothetical protein [Yersinia phage fHe-Yen9-04]